MAYDDVLVTASLGSACALIAVIVMDASSTDRAPESMANAGGLRRLAGLDFRIGQLAARLRTVWRSSEFEGGLLHRFASITFDWSGPIESPH